MMKSQLLTLFALFATAALALPATTSQSQNEKRDFVVCTEATQGQPCEVVNAEGLVAEGSCLFDPVSLSFLSFVLTAFFFSVWGFWQIDSNIVE